MRVHTASGAVGVGWARLQQAGAEALVGRRLGELFSLPDGALAEGVAIDLPLWDLAARLQGLPLYRLLGARGSRAVELYDGSIYIDDLNADDVQARRSFAKRCAPATATATATSRSRSAAVPAGCRPPPAWSATCW